MGKLMYNDDRKDAVLERKASVHREDSDDSRSQSISDHREKIRGIREKTDTTDIPKPEMAVDVSEQAVFERKSALRREDSDDYRSQDIIDHREKIRGIRENAGTTDIPEPEKAVDVSEQNENLIVPVHRKEKISAEKETDAAKWLGERISKKEERQDGEEDKKSEKEEEKRSKKEKRNLRKSVKI